MGSEHHHPVHSEALRDAAAARLRSAGQQWTPMRAAVFDAIAGATGQPASAYDLADSLSHKMGKRVAANSVYRILDLFVTHDLVRRVESANAFVANAHPGCLHDCIFLICDDCGRTTHLDDDRLADGVRAAAESTGFAATRPVIEVRGRCGDCR